MTDLCEQFGISRKTGYKHLERYRALGLAGPQPRSCRPHHSPERTDEAVTALILAERRAHRTWGPKKLQAVHERKHGLERPPACSTIAELLRRHGLSVRHRRRPGEMFEGIMFYRLPFLRLPSANPEEHVAPAVRSRQRNGSLADSHHPYTIIASGSTLP